MNCLHCGTELIHGGDHDGEEGDDYDIVSNLSCPKCETYVYVYHTFNFPTMEKQKEMFEDDDNNIQQELFSPDMWEHYCPEEESEMEIGKGEPCNWCGAEEK